MNVRRLLTGALLFVICVLPLGVLTSVPRRHADYVPEQSVLPEVRLDGEWAHVFGVRDFVHRADSTFDARYRSRSYHVPSVQQVWFGLSPFAEWRGPAHAFVSFELSDGEFVALSFEARKQVGERYTPVRGLWRRYELMLVIGTEPDVVGLRTLVWHDPVYLYPGNATPAQAQRLFLALLERAEQLRRDPEYYHTIWNNCATNLADAVNAIAPERLGWHHSLLLPGYSDSYAWEQGLLAIPAPPASVRQLYLANDRARGVMRTEFSRRIRGTGPPPQNPE